MNGNTSNIFKLNVRAINPYWSPCHVARNLSSNCGPDFPTWPFFQNPMAQQRSTPNTVTGLHLVKEIEALNTWHWWRHRRCQRAILRYHVDPEGWNCKSIVKVMTPAMSKTWVIKGTVDPWREMSIVIIEILGKVRLTISIYQHRAHLCL